LFAAVAVLLAGAVSALAVPPEKGGATKDPRKVEEKAGMGTESALVPGEPDVRPRGLDRPIDPDTYVLGPGDALVLVIRSGEQREIPLRVLPEGTLIFPNVGPKYVAGVTLTELRRRITRELQPYYRNVELHLQLVTPRQFVVYVLGEVEKPGPVQMLPPFRLDTAIRDAGGVTNRGSRRAIEIRNDDGAVRTADLNRLLRLGDLEQNPMLREGQTVFVPSRGPYCTVIGEVWRSGSIEVLPGETVSDALALAGGVTPNAASDRILIERLGNDESLVVLQVAPDAEATTAVTDRDVIVVPDRRTFPGTDFVRIEGGQGREGKILIEQGETMSNFITRFIRLREDHDLEHAVVERRIGDGDTQFIPVDLRKVITGEDGRSLVLLPGDVVSIPLLDNMVYVTGEVAQPGPIAFQGGLPAGRYIALAGGPSDKGSIDRLEIYDAEGCRRGAGRDSQVYRGETLLVKRRKSVIFGTIFIGLTSLATLVLATVAVSQ